MTETEYIIATNRVKISLMRHILRDVLPGDDYGISDKVVLNISRSLSKTETKLFKMIQLMETEGE